MHIADVAIQHSASKTSNAYIRHLGTICSTLHGSLRQSKAAGSTQTHFRIQLLRRQKQWDDV